MKEKTSPMTIDPSFLEVGCGSIAICESEIVKVIIFKTMKRRSPTPMTTHQMNERMNVKKATP